MLTTEEKNSKEATELKILIGLAHGYSTTQLSKHLKLDKSTAYRTLERARARLGAKTNTEAVAIAVHKKLFEYGTFIL